MQAKSALLSCVLGEKESTLHSLMTAVGVTKAAESRGPLDMLRCAPDARAP